MAAGFSSSGLASLRLLQPEAEPVRRVGGDRQWPLPFCYLAAELLELRRVAHDCRVDCGSRAQSQASWAESNSGWAGLPDSAPARARWSTWAVRKSRGTAWAAMAGGTVAARLCERPGRRWHQFRQLSQTLGVLADEHRNPCRHGLPVPFGETGQELLPGRHRDRQLQGVAPVGQVRSYGDPVFQNRVAGGTPAAAGWLAPASTGV